MNETAMTPRVHFTTWDDYAVMAMVESGLGISMLPELILKRMQYKIVAKELDVPAKRNIVVALRDRKNRFPCGEAVFGIPELQECNLSSLLRILLCCKVSSQ